MYKLKSTDFVWFILFMSVSTLLFKSHCDNICFYSIYFRITTNSSLDGIKIRSKI